MKTMILAMAAALALGTGAAYAGDGEGTLANTAFTEIPGVIAQAPVASSRAVAQNGNAVMAYVTTEHHAAWTFPWNPNEGVGG